MPWRSRVGLGLLGAFVLPVLVLAAVSVYSVRQRAETRKQYVKETYAGLADIVSTKLSEGMESWERELLAELEGTDWSQEALIRRLQKVEAWYGELQPIVLLDDEGRIVYPLAACDCPEPAIHEQFAWLQDKGKSAELEMDDYAMARDYYGRAAAAATSIGEKAAALNNLARVELKLDNPARAADLYAEVIELAEPLDTRLARYGVIARLERGAALEATGKIDEACADSLAALEFLQQQRFNLDSQTYEYYRHEAKRQIGDLALDSEQQIHYAKRLAYETDLDDVAAALPVLIEQLPQVLAAAASDAPGAKSTVAKAVAAADDATERLAEEWTVRYVDLPADRTGGTVVSHREGTGWKVARRWRPASARKMMEWLIKSEGPWQGYGVALLDPEEEPVYASTGSLGKEWVPSRLRIPALPGWTVVTYPMTGTLDAEAERDVISYALLLGVAFFAAVAGLVLASRTVSRELALAHTRSEFVSNVSHELKTPLALIRMFAENLRSGWVPESKREEYYEVMLSESERLSSVIDNVLNFSRIESGRRTYQFRPTDMNELVTDIAKRYRYSLQTAGIDLRVRLPKEPLTAQVDREAIAQVLVNLLSNAAKYIGEGERRITLSLDGSAGNASIAVEDTGVGMSPDVIDQIFTPFCRLDDERAGEVAGSGIGLTIVRHIVDAHEGEIVVDSEPGRGSTFTVSVPIVAKRRSSTREEPDYTADFSPPETPR
jgi:signal transduction histidine kinase